MSLRCVKGKVPNIDSLKARRCRTRPTVQVPCSPIAAFPLSMELFLRMTRNFNVSGFKLPTLKVFTASTSASAQIPSGIPTTSDGAKSFVSRLAMQTGQKKDTGRTSLSSSQL
ncbi:hypothetical protein KIN20_003440 [Parelaphostrongylus tenuis]|uniref:Uncharacterized protein n=1 Tax=Parelaphostrongylus tenuis TaxID=148309 RepID=A0AAD5QEC4_PARTN|nr:hypothetical protein KIN20_003440 [Parelaphostrongylus tenuis]